MVAIITPTAKLSKVLDYNEKKVAQNKAELIHVKNFLQDKDRLTYPEKLGRFQRLHELNTRAQVNTLHITINFVPGEILSNQQHIAIANRYMQGIGLENQPYLVYRHDDASHPHLHIVSTLIQPDGVRIKTNYIGKKLSEPTRKAIEKEFNLVPAGGKKQRLDQTPATTERITRVLQEVNRDYKFGSLAEYNAILRGHNVIATASRKTGGLYYTATDDGGNRISPPIFASKLDGPYTLPFLEKKFAAGNEQRKEDLPSIRHRIDYALTQHPGSLPDLVRHLHQEKIDLVIYRRAGQQAYGLTYVDHATRTAINGGDLGKSYTAAAILKALPAETKQARSPRQESKQVTTPAFNLHVPQILSHLMESDPAFGPSPKSLDEDQQLRRKHRRH